MGNGGKAYCHDTNIYITCLQIYPQHRALYRYIFGYSYKMKFVALLYKKNKIYMLEYDDLLLLLLIIADFSLQQLLMF